MDSVWIVLCLVAFFNAAGLSFIFNHFTKIYQAQMDITDALIRKVRIASTYEEEQQWKLGKK